MLGGGQLIYHTIDNTLFPDRESVRSVNDTQRVTGGIHKSRKLSLSFFLEQSAVFTGWKNETEAVFI